jgi:hydroxymethylglutaryl-CoA lyase
MKKIAINEVVTRDGFQIESDFIDTDAKISLIDKLSECGFAKIEVTSFTSAKAIPALRDAAEVMARIVRRPEVEYTVLVPNIRGAERAIEARADELNLVMSVSETHNLANLRMTRARSRDTLGEIIRRVEGLIPLNVSLSCCFGCPMEGQVEYKEVFALASWFADCGVRGLTICDTTGMANPESVKHLIGRLNGELLAHHTELELTLHFHNTRGMGLANIVAALTQDIVRFDCSLGGLGGCPYAPGATGNVCTEDTVHMLEAMGHSTGIDLACLLEAAHSLPAIVRHDVPGQVVKAGTAMARHPVPDYVKQLMESTQ